MRDGFTERFPSDEIMDTCVFRVSLIDDYEELECWREIEVPGTSKLYSLAAGIVAAFGFDFDHAFGFYDNLTGYYSESAVKYELFADMGDEVEATGPPEAKSVKKTKTAEAFTEPGQKMQFLFDYGDEWRFLIELLRVGKKTKGKRYPLVLKKVGQAPEQYPDWDEDEDDQ